LTEMFEKGQNSEMMKFKGKVSWVRGVQPNKFDRWSLNLHPDATSLEVIRDLQAEGVKNVIKKDEDGYYLQISRPTTVEMRKGYKQPVTPPILRREDGSSLEGVAIGNGSDAVVTCEVYSHPVPNSEKRAKAMRWYALDVVDLIPFDRPEDNAWNGQTS